jgi:hypothetical protein
LQVSRFEIDKLVERLRCRLACRVTDYGLAVRANGLVLKGCCRSYQAKQMAQHFAAETTEAPVVANEIEVCEAWLTSF